MTLTMGSEVAGSTLPFEVSLAFWPARLCQAAPQDRAGLGLGYGLLSAKTSAKPLPRSPAGWRHPVLVAMVTTPPC